MNGATREKRNPFRFKREDSGELVAGRIYVLRLIDLRLDVLSVVWVVS